MSSIPFLRKVWRHSCTDGEYVFLSTKSKDGNWKDHAFKYGDRLERDLSEWFSQHPSEKYDIYFCPLSFSDRKRRKDLVQPPRVLWSDIDSGDPDRLKPSILWQSSPGRTQGLWVLSNKLDPEAAAQLSKGLARHIGGDKAGWDLTQVLRVPGTNNHKYKGSPVVKMLSDSGRIYQSSDIRQQVAVTDQAKKKDQATGSSRSAELILQKYKLPFKIKRLLSQTRAEVGKRSDIIWSIENALHELGMSPNEIITVVRNSIWNKYKGRHDEDLRLRTELEKILEMDRAPKAEDEEEDSTSVGLKIETFQDVMGANHTEPGWMVEGFWMKKSHGIVAGEPKAFKSTLALDLAVSVASGRPFLGQFKVSDQGPVVYIQNENAKWIMQDRLAKITGHKRLLGKVIQADDDRLRVTWPPELPIYMVNQQGFMLTNPAHQRILEKILEEYKPQLLILDPLYLMFDGDLSSSKDLNPTLTWLLELRNKYNTSIMVIHHYNKGSSQNQNPVRGGQRMLGSTTLHGWIESAWYITVKHQRGEVDEENEQEDVNKVAATAGVVLDREFRGAGLHPKIDIEVSMGKFGSSDYGVSVSIHHPEAEKRGRVSPKQAEDEVMNLLNTFKNGIKMDSLLGRLGIDAELARGAVDRLCEKGFAIRKGQLIFKEKK